MLNTPVDSPELTKPADTLIKKTETANVASVIMMSAPILKESNVNVRVIGTTNNGGKLRRKSWGGRGENEMRMPANMCKSKYVTKRGRMVYYYFAQFYSKENGKQKIPLGTEYQKAVGLLHVYMANKCAQDGLFESLPILSSQDRFLPIKGMGIPTRVFSGEEIEQLRGPLVYIWKRGKQVLYVGMSKTGINRPFDPSHHRLKRIQAGDSLIVWRVPDEDRAIKMEGSMILKFKPIYNGKPLEENRISTNV